MEVKQEVALGQTKERGVALRGSRCASEQVRGVVGGGWGGAGQGPEIQGKEPRSATLLSAGTATQGQTGSSAFPGVLGIQLLH